MSNKSNFPKEFIWISQHAPQIMGKIKNDTPDRHQK
jgi:hypothetical protein